MTAAQSPGAACRTSRALTRSRRSPRSLSLAHRIRAPPPRSRAWSTWGLNREFGPRQAGQMTLNADGRCRSDVEPHGSDLALCMIANRCQMRNPQVRP
jgi:hypothetical protein